LGAMANRKERRKKAGDRVPISVIEAAPLWELDIVEVSGHNLEARGREEVNRLLKLGWRLLHIYIWRERPMGILGRLGSKKIAEGLSVH